MSAHLSGIWPPRVDPETPESDRLNVAAFTFKSWSMEEIGEAAFWLETGEPMPARLALPLKRALLAVLDGDLDIARNLGLRPTRGRACDMPGVKETLAQRDSLICQAVASAPGKTFTAKVRHVHMVCQAMRIEKTAPPSATKEEHELWPWLSGGKKIYHVPKSLDQLKAIASGRNGQAPKELLQKKGEKRLCS